MSPTTPSTALNATRPRSKFAFARPPTPPATPTVATEPLKLEKLTSFPSHTNYLGLYTTETWAPTKTDPVKKIPNPFLFSTERLPLSYMAAAPWHRPSHAAGRPHLSITTHTPTHTRAPSLPHRQVPPRHRTKPHWSTTHHHHVHFIPGDPPSPPVAMASVCPAPPPSPLSPVSGEGPAFVAAVAVPRTPVRLRLDTRMLGEATARRSPPKAQAGLRRSYAIAVGDRC